MAFAVAQTDYFPERFNDALGYAGDITSEECWNLLVENNDAALVDVRTQAEWAFVGVPNLQSLNKHVHGICWKLYPTMQVNTDFITQLEQVVPNKETPIAFLCKTGGRSLDAAVAATQAGYKHAYNVAHGFEGDKNEHGQRGEVNGWKATRLAWEQQ